MDNWGSGQSWYSRVYENVKSTPQRPLLTTFGLVVVLAPHGYASTHHTIYLGNSKDDHLFDNDFDVYHDVYSRLVVFYVCAIAAFYAAKAENKHNESNLLGYVVPIGNVVVAIMLAFVLTMGVFVVRLTECSYRENTGVGLWAVVPLVLIAIH